MPDWVDQMRKYRDVVCEKMKEMAVECKSSYHKQIVPP